MDGSKDSPAVAARQVGPPNRAGKQRISREQQPRSAKQHANTALGVAGRVQDLAAQRGQANDEAVLGACIRRRHRRRSHAEPPSLHLHHAEQHKVGLVQQDGCAGRLLEGERSADMVDMRVRDEDFGQSKAVSGQPGQDLGSILLRREAGIDNDRLAGRRITKYGAVAGQQPYRESLA